MYEYIIISGEPPTLTYLYLWHNDITQNGFNNPFYAGWNSPLPSPPSQIGALYTYTPDNLFLAFVDVKIYRYYITTENWEYLGVVKTP